MQIHLCKKSVERFASDFAPLLSTLRDREHVPLVKDCLNRCQRCDLGGVIAIVDGTPVSAPTLQAFLDDVDTLASENP